jgi:serine/threonine protein kinase
MLCAINFIHSTGVIHRDLKPANVLVDENSHVKICDFGLSTVVNQYYDANDMASVKKSMVDVASEEQKAVTEPKSKGKKTRTLSAHMCARWYRPPEIILNQDSYDYLIDIWSLGCIFAEMASNE